MTLRLDGRLQIENLGKYPQETVEKLRDLLAGGAEAQPDPRRKNFYDVHNCSQVFFIHISPVSGNVMLLASWLKEANAALAQAKTDLD
jgi:hypothetical protein